jgi:hypothetical protein
MTGGASALGVPRVSPIGARLAALAAAGGLVAVWAGATAATGDMRTPALAALAVAGLVGLTWAYVTQPVWTLVALWIGLLLQRTVADAFGKHGPLGRLLTEAENPVLLWLLVLSIGSVILRRPKHLAVALVPAAGFTVAAVASWLFHGYSAKVMVLGLWLDLKFWIVLFVCLAVPWTRRDVERVIRVMIVAALVVAALGVVDFLVPHQFRALLRSSQGIDYRFGLPSVKSIFPIPAIFASFMSFAFAIALARYLRIGRRADLWIMIACGVVGLLSLRLKSVLGIGAALGLAAMVAPRDLFRRVGFVALVVAMVVGLGGGVAGDVAARQVNLYLGDDNVTPRQRLYDTSLQIAQDEFPLGVGTGRFASATSGRYYSEVYDRYNLSERNGLSRRDPAFVSDTSWPAVLGEGGWLGLIFFGGGLVLLLVRLMAIERTPARRSAAGLAAVLALGALLIESTGRPALFDMFTLLSVSLLVAPVLQGAAFQDRPVLAQHEVRDRV